MLTIHEHHYPRADTHRLYVPRKEGERELKRIGGAYTAEVMKLMEYVESREDPLIQIVRTQQHHTNSNHLKLLRILRDLFRVKQSQLKHHSS